ncbi:CD302 antigen [Salvelinus alpinus]|uniref:CD302 antigen-like n=1 Tax=Salvelinus namaycush TaxID=8040 RepID=A0A8U1F7H0_SALNM|nr:CD302 antigen [Salvelinus alpinus]XP_038870910.1 CD302 antigen-like [Salvelinus namaycush]
MESLKKCRLCPIYLWNFLFVVVCWQYTLAGDCPADGRTWVPFRQRCYHFVHGEEDVAKSYTIDAAKTICSGYELVSVQSAEENNFIIKYSPQVWKGNIHVWLGMYYDSDDEDFKWQDETGLSFNNWGNSSSESELIPMDTCVAMHSSTGEWKKVSCVENPENGVVCETAETKKDGKLAPSPLLSALVILSVIGIMGISAVFWFLHQKHRHGTVLTSFEYHPPFRSPTSDEACLVETEETDDMA